MDLSQLGASGAVVIVVILFLRFMKDEATKRDITYGEVAKALNQLTKATNNNTTATKAADSYLKQRNGRDNERHAEDIKIQKTMVEEMKKIPDTIYSTQQQRHTESEAILTATQAIPKTLKTIADTQAKAIIDGVTLKSQHVEVQHVEKEIIHGKETA